ncbi:germ cell nuclear acidic protein-like [Leptidea sinapis]|uniref:germ cell nuclear acidic protein-like n=1 Tax=Leptidea sinapis TaxID=189913 RepID=UPI0021305D20|nr:germ cell nuclear acidic protein-like [Leptidea sinapis]XP_050678073.1 germ cell nuclear acidic protein-like [Leptidea sinapis]
MDIKKSTNGKSRFRNLSLKKNKQNIMAQNVNRVSDVIIIDESFEHLRPDLTKNTQQSPNNIIYSPITINDSDECLPQVVLEKEPSRNGNVPKNPDCVSPINDNESKPSNKGWSPAQSIICAKPQNEPAPSTPRHIANESQEHCSMEKIQSSHQKLLNDLYGEVWKSIPTLFKKRSQKHNDLNGVTKKLNFDDSDSDKENIRDILKYNRELYLTDSDRKYIKNDNIDLDRKSKKKLYTEKVPCTPELPKIQMKDNRNVKSTTKKKKGLTVTELVQLMNTEDKDVANITRKVSKVTVTATNDVNRLSFLGSLTDNVPHWRCHPEALQYHDNYKTLKEKLCRRLFTEFNKAVFDNAFDADLPILWDTKLRSTAGTTTNRLIKNSSGERIRVSSIKLSSKVVDNAERLRDTLIHELCHAATWLLDGEIRAGHGPLWRKWASKAVKLIPELGQISVCHDLAIHYKYTYQCQRCGYSIKRHSKSIDVTKKCCGYCRGTFEVNINRKTKDGGVVSTPARRAPTSQFALFVKQHYAGLKEGRSHAEVMKMLGEMFSARKHSSDENEDSDNIGDIRG